MTTLEIGTNEQVISVITSLMENKTHASLNVYSNGFISFTCDEELTSDEMDKIKNSTPRRMVLNSAVLKDGTA